jgi:Flp pilus assembly protein TadG
MPARDNPRPLLGDDRGISAVEFALVLPVLLLLAMGIAEVGRFALLAMKVNHAAATLGDLAAREETLTGAFVDSLFDAVEHVMEPFDIAAEGAAFVSGVGLDGGRTEVLWQRQGAGSLAVDSVVGSVGNVAALPEGLEARTGETILATEVIFRYEPWLLGLVPETTVRRVSYFRPRLGSLQSLD